jgi:hypothetical protein
MALEKSAGPDAPPVGGVHTVEGEISILTDEFSPVG